MVYGFAATKSARACQRSERGKDALGRLGVAGVGQHAHQDDRADRLLREERHGRRRHDVGDRRELVRRRIGGGDEAFDHVGRPRQHEHAAGELADVRQPVLEAGHDAEVAAAAADRPEQVRLVLGVDASELSIGRHDLGGEDVVDRQAMEAAEVADATAGGEAADPDRAGVPEAGRETVLDGRGRVLDRGQAGFRPGGPVRGVDLEALHVLEIDDDAAVDGAVSGCAVTAAANSQLDAVIAREVHDGGDIVGVRHADDRRGTPFGGNWDEDGSGRVVVGVFRADHPAADRGTQVRDGDGCCRLLHRTTPLPSGGHGLVVP